MKLCISNIAWPLADEERAANIMAAAGLQAVEVAPTKIWPNPLEATPSEIDNYRHFWNDRGIQIVAIQSLLFGRTDLKLFGDETSRNALLTYLRGIFELSRRLGVRVLVFGSPKNRRVAGLTAPQVEEIAVTFFRAAGEAAHALGLVLCIEPNPAAYDCDFITTTEQGLDLVRKVATSGFGLHLDTAAMKLSGESPREALSRSAGVIDHFHASEPFLGPIGQGGVEHGDVAATLREIHYSNWVSVEMRAPEHTSVEAELPRVLSYLQAFYGTTENQRS